MYNKLFLSLFLLINSTNLLAVDKSQKRAYDNGFNYPKCYEMGNFLRAMVAKHKGNSAISLLADPDYMKLLESEGRCWFVEPRKIDQKS